MTDEEKKEINKLKEKYQTEFLDDYEIRFIFNVVKKQQEEIEKKDNIVKSIISRLNNDINNIAETKAKKSEHYLDDYTRCRLKAYKTKTKEIKEYIEKEYFINKVEKEN